MFFEEIDVADVIAGAVMVDGKDFEMANNQPSSVGAVRPHKTHRRLQHRIHADRITFTTSFGVEQISLPAAMPFLVLGRLDVFVGRGLI